MNRETTQESRSRLSHEVSDSVFRYLERTSEPVSDGTRWQTLKEPNKPRYSAGVYSGVAGISFFLSDYSRIACSETAKNLALSSLEWCSSEAREIKVVDLGAGQAGIGLAWLRFYEATGQPQGLDRARNVGNVILDLPPGVAFEHDSSGDVLATELFRGLAGQGVFLLRLWDITKDERILAFLADGVNWLIGSATRNDLGCYWPIYIRRSGKTAPESGLLTGFCHGIAGIGYFLAMLCERSNSVKASKLLMEIHETLSKHEIKDEGKIAWKRWIEYPNPAPCQWCHGTAGIGLFYVKAAEVLGKPELLQLAVSAGESTFDWADFRTSPIQCHGLAGNGELFLELHRLTGDDVWLSRATIFATRILKYRKSTSQGEVWEGDEPDLYSPDFYLGASGIGHFFLRLAHSETVRMPLA